MRRAIAAFVVGAVIAAGAAAGILWAQRGGGDVPASQVAIGGKMPNMQLQTLAGAAAPLHSLAGQKGTLVMFIATKCPVSNAYNERMAQLAKDYTAQGFAVIGINSNRTEPADEVAKHAADKGLSFTIVKDPENRVADYLGASFTPETYLFDTDWVLRYHGRIDDSQNPANISSRDLRAAMDAVLAGKSVPVAETKAFGCTIKRVPRT